MKSWVGAAAAAIALLTPAVQADTCNKPLKLITSIPLTAGPEHRELFVPVEIGGKSKMLQLDTGAYTSLISRKFADELGLVLHDSRVRVFDMTGSYTDRQGVTSFKIGRLQFAGAEFMVTESFNNYWRDNPEVVGVLGANFLTRYDLSIDPAGDKLDLLDPDHCPDAVIYWPAAAYGKVPLDETPDTKIVVKVKLDGKPIDAILDTGAWNSTIFIKAAKVKYGITPGSVDTPVEGKLNGGENLTTYSHQFHSLEFEGVEVSNPTIELIPDKITEHLTYTPIGSHISHVDKDAQPEMLIGMDILRHLHLYIAYHERALYVTPLAAPAPAAPAKP